MNLTAALAIVVVGGCSRTPTRATTQASSQPFLAFTSTAGDLIGRGRSEWIDLRTVTFAGGMSNNNRVMRVTILGASTLSPIGLTLAAPGQTLAPGVYSNARFAIGGESLSFSIAGSACDSRGQFEVLDIAFGPSGGFGGYSGSIERLRATFRQAASQRRQRVSAAKVLLVNTSLG